LPFTCSCHGTVSCAFFKSPRSPACGDPRRSKPKASKPSRPASLGAHTKTARVPAARGGGVSGGPKIASPMRFEKKGPSAVLPTAPAYSFGALPAVALTGARAHRPNASAAPPAAAQPASAPAWPAATQAAAAPLAPARQRAPCGRISTPARAAGPQPHAPAAQATPGRGLAHTLQCRYRTGPPVTAPPPLATPRPPPPYARARPARGSAAARARGQVWRPLDRARARRERRWRTDGRGRPGGMRPPALSHRRPLHQSRRRLAPRRPPFPAPAPSDTAAPPHCAACTRPRLPPRSKPANPTSGEYEPRESLLRRSAPAFTFKGVDASKGDSRACYPAVGAYCPERSDHLLHPAAPAASIAARLPPPQSHGKQPAPGARAHTRVWGIDVGSAARRRGTGLVNTAAPARRACCTCLQRAAPARTPRAHVCAHLMYRTSSRTLVYARQLPDALSASLRRHLHPPPPVLRTRHCTSPAGEYFRGGEPCRSKSPLPVTMKWRRPPPVAERPKSGHAVPGPGE
jgi:hypothetical protein